ncbi:unnamed protein product [Paramecium octaurelia]|uniref:Translocon Sec61/SecY plug domain-containing protein n=1 Tax=Paramecium octaurelia TaxID=43137 RepID=A0A8S1VH60_PAROT|nr:unnamed protein product [Paramecium octaurelia]
MRLLHLLRPALSIIPEVQEPRFPQPLKVKVLITGITLFIYLICCQIPLYGVYRTSGSDPFYWMRVILASNKGTLMELGISPIVTSGMILQFLSGVGFIEVNHSVREDKVLFNAAQKLLSFIMAIAEGMAYIWSGAYGDINQIGAGNAILILLQLTFAGVIVTMLDEMLQKGYGLGSGISLFIATNVSENILWKSFSPITLSTEAGTQFEGAIINFFHLLFTKQNTLQALYYAFFRESAPNLNNLLATLFVISLVIYLQGFRVEVPLASQKIRGLVSSHGIKLFYTSNIPMIIQSTLVQNVYFLSQLLYRRFKTNFFVKLLGTWQEAEFGGQSVPIGGLAYYMSPLRDVKDIINDPIHAVVYVLFVVFMCGFFAKFWIQISGESAKDVARKFKDEQIKIKGLREESMVKYLSGYIPVAAFCGGVCIGLLTIVADILGAIGSGTGILLAVTIIYGYFETFHKEKYDNQSIF